MKKTAEFASVHYERWPLPQEIEHYFLAPPGQRWFFHTGDDTARFDAEDIDGADGAGLSQARGNVSLALSAHPILGVQLQWSQWDGKRGHTFYAKGDLARLKQFVRNLYDDPLPVGLLVPFEVAWRAVKEFIETDGKLPKSIEWIEDEDLPTDIFPDPHDPIVEERLIRAPYDK
jgi:immunity protein Imm1 of predicted polymorphic toxin system